MKYTKITIIVIIIIIVITGLIIACDNLFNQDNHLTDKNMKIAKNVRKPAAAGAFYPGSADELNQAMLSLIGQKKPAEGKIMALVAPHAGYTYSGKVAGQAFSSLKGENYKTVWLLGPSHQTSFAGVSVPSYTHYQTPLGEVPVSSIVRELLNEKNFQNITQAHQQEHALEVELPFLQSTLENFEIVPMIFGNQTSLEQIREIASILKKYYTSDTLIIISCDFTHYGPNYGYVPFTENASEKIKAIDGQVISYLLDYQTDELFNYLQTTAITNDGAGVLTWLAEFFSDSDVKGELVAYDTSGNITGDSANSVSYTSLIFTGEMPADSAGRALNQNEKNYLLNLARQTLNHYYDTGEKLTVNESQIPPRLKVEQGVFVTLEKNKQLRGCIGYIEPVKSIYQSVIDNAISAAVNDHRFQPVTKDELNDIEIEISVLSVPQLLAVPALDRLTALRPLTDGVVLREGQRSSTYLPQVWEDLKDPEDFLQSLCQKGGWPSTCWKDDEVQLYTYQADVFGKH
ncbi:AmmeMemoRadiSam system protein B [Patescibacteria group bacterium]|nr:AmmeMemoRadiSam system protein B [Patescibacteria group bacterium]